ncbi:hypothetical protein PC129_g22998 [Phytophthora cactorum]|uniref:Uncharacterized protein n=1 Tax=Phytophthora cactorum TaxID=29920 RepID=A0A8T1EQV6_9STRA|nr:hypothetical protein PC112_g22712 [Phytophthora cactorum]KAG2820317.1 hypothetical protein PC113_g22617 [Phytophthora cactorum]KAG2872790.1 hypothetical protein PC114_g26189 [Phytophthora cactorum]KAG2879907.1 hypothetical protein PC115_g22668 [Phytophthora cactorum]KAG2886780.1 hypothetical protein PC117_g25304 [Phytophthora cactorum]
MSRKRKKKEDPDNPDTWDIVADSQELGDFYPTDFDIPEEKEVPDKDCHVEEQEDADETDKPQRQKSPDTILEKAFKKGKGYCSVVCRLDSICSDSLLCEEIGRSAQAMKQIQMEAWHLVNLYTLRYLEIELPLPDYSSKTLFDHCCAGVSTTSQTYLIARKNPDLWESIKIYQSQRERTGLSEVDHLTGYSKLKHKLREQMVVNAGVMIREHFRKRLKLYVGITFGDVAAP